MSASNKAPGLFERKPYILALILTVVLVGWMASGSLQSKEVAAKGESKHETKLPKVEVTSFEASSISRSIELYGRTEPTRSLELSAELDGRVAEILVDEGQNVVKGQAIVKLVIDDRIEQIEFAKALVAQREIEYAGMKSLSDKGLQGQSLLAQSKAALVSAKANLKHSEIMLEKSTIRAPYSGVLDEQNIELGSYVNKGQVMFTLIDLNPLVVSANVTEAHIAKLDLNTKVVVKMVDGSVVNGRMSYLASVSDKGTNTFPVEIEIDNPNQRLRAGVSTEISLLFDNELAIKVTPALLSLDQLGNLGVKTVEDGVVKFNPIDLIKADRDGVWLGGFNDKTDVITLGQGFVKIGDKVNVSYKQL